jgi:cytochrome oxidase assembly protein ShyY1
VRFLFSRRWVLFALAVGVLAWLATQLGQWQFDRLDNRRSENELVSRNIDRPPVPVDTVMKVGSGPSPDDEWRRVVVHGTWDDTSTIVLKYQTRDGGAGVDVVTPLRTVEGAAVLVDRGWLATDNDGGTRPDLPAASTGQVTVTGWVRRDATGSATRVSDLATRAISSEEIAKVLPYPLYGGFLDLDSETPPPATELGATELPDDDSEGPHFFYGLQWWFFGVLAVVGFCYLAWDERRKAQRERSMPPSTGSITPVTNPAAGDSKNAAARPNSSGRP